MSSQDSTAAGASALEALARPISTFFAEAAGRFPDQVYLSVGERHLTYAQSAVRVRRIAAALQARGVVHGDRVAVCLPNIAAYPLLLAAIWSVGAVSVCMNPAYGDPMLRGQVTDSGARLVFALDEARSRETFDVATLGEAQLVFCAPDGSDLDLTAEPGDGARLSGFLVEGGDPAPVAIDPERDLASIQYTSGTTGKPKGVMLTHANLYWSVMQLREAMPRLTDGQVVVPLVGPLGHIGGLQSGLNLVTYLAGRLILMSRFDVDQVLDAIHNERVTYFGGVPTVFIAILNSPRVSTIDWSSVGTVLVGAAPPPVEVQDEFQQRSGTILQPGYGLTECMPIAFGPAAGRSDLSAAGPLVGHTQVELRDIRDPARPASEGQAGEICVRGPQATSGYWNKPEETEALFVDGWLRTGDVGLFDAEGMLHIVDRIKDMIICSGFNVYPTLVEEAIYRHPAVEQCIVLGVPDPYRGETVKAYVSPRPGCEIDPAELQTFLRAYLAPMEIPKLWEVRRALPVNAVSKLSRAMLRDELAQAG